MRSFTILTAVILASGIAWTQAVAQNLGRDPYRSTQPEAFKRDTNVYPAQAPVPARPAAPPGASVPVVPRPPAQPLPATPAASTPVVPGATAPTPPATAPGAVATTSDPELAALLAAPTTSGGFDDTRQFSRGAMPQMIGDQAPFAIRTAVQGLPKPFPPGPPPPAPNPRVATALVPSVRGFKIGENQSPQPQDRFFFTFNYFDNLNAAINKRFDSPVNGLKAYRYIWGFEKTFDEGNGSFGIRLPLNTITANSALTGNFAKQGGTSTSLGDLSVFAKYILKQDLATGSLISVGIEITPPTGPSQFGGARYIQGLHSTEIQPFVGYLWIRDRFYFHGFTALSTPTSLRDITIVYNDLGIGYQVYRNDDRSAFLRGITPTFEVHANTPLTHRDPFNARDIAGTADVVDLTYGVNAILGDSGVLSFGAVTPVTGPRPFNIEYLMLFNYKFGRSRRASTPLPILGG